MNALEKRNLTTEAKMQTEALKKINRCHLRIERSRCCRDRYLSGSGPDFQSGVEKWQKKC